MSSRNLDNRVINIVFSTSSLQCILADGRKLSTPLAWFPKLRDAPEEDRNNWRLIGNGMGVHWPSIDEDIAIDTLLGR